jgi:hypothetical protein
MPQAPETPTPDSYMAHDEISDTTVPLGLINNAVYVAVYNQPEFSSDRMTVMNQSSHHSQSKRDHDCWAIYNHQGIAGNLYRLQTGRNQSWATHSQRMIQCVLPSFTGESLSTSINRQAVVIDNQPRPLGGGGNLVGLCQVGLVHKNYGNNLLGDAIG